MMHDSCLSIIRLLEIITTVKEPHIWSDCYVILLPFMLICLKDGIFNRSPESHNNYISLMTKPLNLQ